MGLYQTLGDDLKQAMKAGEVFKRDTLRLLQSAVKNVAIEKRRAALELSDTEVEEVIKRLVKQRRDSATQYRAGNREDLALQEEQELALLSAYLPEAMPEEKLQVLVRETLQEAGLMTKDKMGQAMGLSMKQVAGRASGDDVRRIVESLLS
ncbi:MAG: GatB/YqeY domain-containing protein [Candidatus Moranbacteria bacterium]|nr:GatB/YqeY domain-containing protein [Candidatus Moranbacteria bacterium]